MTKKVSRQGQGGGVPSRDALYRKVAKHAEAAIDYVAGVMLGEVPAHPVRLGAAKLLLNKALPDLRATELTGDKDRPLGVVVLPTLYDDSKVEATSRPADGIPKKE